MVERRESAEARREVFTAATAVVRETIYPTHFGSQRAHELAHEVVFRLARRNLLRVPEPERHATE